MPVHVTDHAFARAKERLGFSRPATQRMAERAFVEGKTHAEVRGRLSRYCDRLYLAQHNADNIRLHGNVVWLFAKDRLITVIHIPNEARSKGRR